MTIVASGGHEGKSTLRRTNSRWPSSAGGQAHPCSLARTNGRWLPHAAKQPHGRGAQQSVGQQDRSDAVEQAKHTVHAHRPAEGRHAGGRPATAGAGVGGNVSSKLLSSPSIGQLINTHRNLSLLFFPVHEQWQRGRRSPEKCISHSEAVPQSGPAEAHVSQWRRSRLCQQASGWCRASREGTRRRRRQC